ncbi:unnamed protein product [Closterium sp. NIES-65]|nr:unnamed protein product [Closterium sp. NIES-65]
MVNLAEAQKVFNLVQGLSKQQQFVKYISNAGLLSVLLESITKGNGAGATFLVPSPDALQSLPPASPYFNNPSLARTTLRYHMILGKQMDYTALVERPADTGFPTLAKESMFKSDESAFFTVVFRSGSGRSKSTLLAPNLAKTEFFQVHLVDSLLVPDAILHSMPDGGDAAGGSDGTGSDDTGGSGGSDASGGTGSGGSGSGGGGGTGNDAGGSSSGGDSTGAGSLSPPPSVPSPSVPSPPLNPSPPPTVSSPPTVNPSPPPPSPSPPPPESSPPPPVSSPPTPDSSSPSAPIESTQATTPPSPSPPPPTNESTSSATPSPP